MTIWDAITVLPSADWEWVYGSFVFGGTTSYSVTAAEGISPPEIRVDETQRMGDHGSFIFADFLDKRTVTIVGELVSTSRSDFEAKLVALKAAFVPQSANQPLVYQFEGSAPRAVYCMPARTEFPVGFDYNLMRAPWTVQLVAGDPRIHDAALMTFSSNPVDTTVGVSFDLIFDVNFGGGSGGQTDASNAGIIDALPFARITGPCSNPQLVNLTTSETLKVNIDIAPGDYLDIDFYDKTVMLNGTASRYYLLATGSKWWKLAPGSNSIAFLADGSSSLASLLTLSWRSAWT